MDIRKTENTLDPSGIPYDITFVIENCGSKVEAHKFIMAMNSPVCTKQFYGGLKETDSEIVIKSATKDAFITMIDYFYGQEVDWEKKTVEELFEIANMAEKYQVKALKEKIKEVVQKFLHLDEENVVSVAAIAKNYSQFENLSNIILMKCREFLSSVMTVRDDYCKYAEKHAGSGLAGVAFGLLAEMKNVSSAFKGCCKMKTCRRGKPMLEISDFVVGECVRFNPRAKDSVADAHRRPFIDGAVGVVDGTRLARFAATDSIRWIISLDGELTGYWMEYENVATFLFCKC